MVDAHVVSVTVLTEDSSRSARDTVFAFVKRAAVHAYPSCQTQRLRLEPSDTALEKKVVFANRWNSRRQRDEPHKRMLRRHLATMVALGRSLVFFHFDGDVPWSRREECSTRTQFKTEILDKVALILQETPRGDRQGKRQGLSKEDAQRHLSRLVCVVPYYSIEAWAYQNADHLVELCKRHCGHKHARHAGTYEAWRADPAKLDELIQPKIQCCLGNKYNHELVTAAFPWARLEAAKKSFMALVEEVKTREEVLSVLAATTDQMPHEETSPAKTK